MKKSQPTISRTFLINFAARASDEGTYFHAGYMQSIIIFTAKLIPPPPSIQRLVCVKSSRVRARTYNVTLRDSFLAKYAEDAVIYVINKIKWG